MAQVLIACSVPHDLIIGEDAWRNPVVLRERLDMGGWVTDRSKEAGKRSFDRVLRFSLSGIGN